MKTGRNLEAIRKPISSPGPRAAASDGAKLTGTIEKNEKRDKQILFLSFQVPLVSCPSRASGSRAKSKERLISTSAVLYGVSIVIVAQILEFGLGSVPLVNGSGFAESRAEIIIDHVVAFFDPGFQVFGIQDIGAIDDLNVSVVA